MLDSPDGVCAVQARFEYPATSVPSNTRRAASRPTTPPSPSGPAVHGAGLTHARHLRDLRPCAALRRLESATTGAALAPSRNGAHGSWPTSHPPGTEEHTGYLNYVSPRSVAWRRRRGAVWSSAAGESVGAAVVGEESGAESATPQRPVPSRAMCGTAPGELVRDAQGTRVDSRSHPAPVAWLGQARWPSFARSGVSPIAPGRIARGRRPGPGGQRGGHAWPG
jgi:hypothetical protein